MNTEITDTKESNGWVLYDAECGFCTAWAARARRLLATRRLGLLPLQTPWVRERLALTDLELLAEMRLLKPDGRVFGGADALLEICRYYRLAWPLCWLSRLPVMAKVFRAAYRWVARNRHCANGACRIAPWSGHRFFTDYLPIIVLPLLALGFRAHLAPWLFMWAMAFALYAGFKWLTYRAALPRGHHPGWWRTLGYLLLWPGMAAGPFLDAKAIPARPRTQEWLGAVTKLALGSFLLCDLTRRAALIHPLLGGWTGMFGLILVLHFGLFHLCSLVWRRAGVAAPPLMQNPLRAQSIADFWGSRWNTAFNEIAFRFGFRPLRRLTSPALATLLVFGLSGLVHEWVISLPARAAYGLPTIYFLLQALGLIAERSATGRRLGLGSGLRGWLFTLLVTAGPAFWLFNPPFISNVILPMLAAIGAT